MSYRVWIEPDVKKEVRRTPGNVRQRLKEMMIALADNPRPSSSKSLTWPSDNFEPRRLKIDKWRVIYAVDDTDQWVWVLAVRKRPPYDYGDLTELLEQLT